MPRLRLLAASLLVLLLVLHAAPTQAQLAPDSARLALKLNIVRLFYATYQVDAEYRLTRHLSLSLSPRAVRGTVPSAVSQLAHADGDEVRGYGLSLSPRFYLPHTGTDGALLAGLYLGLQADYHHLNLTYKAQTWGQDLGADGLLYYTYRYREGHETIRRLGGAATLGYQSQLLHPRLRLDASASLNYLRSTATGPNLERYQHATTDYGHSGTFWSLNLGLGFVLK